MNNVDFVGSIGGGWNVEDEHNLGDVRSRIQVAILAIEQGKTHDAIHFLRQAEKILDKMIEEE